MKLAFTSTAIRQIDEAIAYIDQRSAEGSANVATRLREVLQLLSEQPFSGVATSRRNVRRFVVTPFPYIVFYRVTQNEVLILRFRHAARRQE